MAADGVTTLYEIGSGKVLAGLAKRIVADAERNLASARRRTSTRRWPSLTQ